MKITAVRIRRLISGPGYENHAIEVEAAVGDEDPEVVRKNLSNWADDQLMAMKGSRELARRGDLLATDIARLERQKEGLVARVRAGNALISKHSEIRDIAIERGVEIPNLFDGMGDELPF